MTNPMFFLRRLRQRPWLLFGIVLVMVSAISLAVAAAHRADMLEKRRQRTIALVDGAASLVRHYGDQVAAGKMDEKVAREAARAAVGAQRYDGNNYFFIVDTDYRMVRHPIKPEMEGQLLAGYQDANGVALFVELVATARRGKREFVNYVWPLALGGQTVPKMLTGTLYAPWNWVIGTGIFIDDVEAEFRQDLLRTGGILSIVAALLLALGWQVVKPKAPPA